MLFLIISPIFFPPPQVSFLLLHHFLMLFSPFLQISNFDLHFFFTNFNNFCFRLYCFPFFILSISFILLCCISFSFKSSSTILVYYLCTSVYPHVYLYLVMHWKMRAVMRAHHGNRTPDRVPYREPSGLPCRSPCRNPDRSPEPDSV